MLFCRCCFFEEESFLSATAVEEPSVADLEGGLGGASRPVCRSSSRPGIGASVEGPMPRYGSA